MATRRVGIIVGGGPAPGINAVIGAATIEAINQGFDVVGFYDGYKWLCSEEFDADVHATPLDIARVARIHFDGGSILRIARASLLDKTSIADTAPVRPDPVKVQRVLSNLRGMEVADLITIGGDDTALSARFIIDAAEGSIRGVHVPKTIDNDLPLPHGVNTFGFSTARFLGTHIAKNLMQDSLTTGRWYIVTLMGRTAGWLALAVGQAAGVTVTLIPEEFPKKTSLQRIADVLEGAMLKRRTKGRPDGVAIVAEGLANHLGDRAELERLMGGRDLPVDAAGHVRLSDVPLGDLLRRELEKRFAARGTKMTVISHTLGYELRSADPAPSDMGYCRSLGHGAVQLLLAEGQNPTDGVMVTLVNGNLVPMKFHDMIDPETNRTAVRRVNIQSDEYRVARAYMIRLERSDLDNPRMLQKLADVAKMTPDQFRQRYMHAATSIADGLPDD